jgi:uncharacterized membrane protein
VKPFRITTSAAQQINVRLAAGRVRCQWGHPHGESELIYRVEDPPLSDLLVIEFPSEEKAEGVRELLLAMQKEYLIELGDAVVAVKGADGRIKLSQLFQPVAQRAASGIFWGSLIGLLVMMSLAGAATGAASGALKGQLTDLGINDDFMKRAARTLQSGNAALFLLIRKMTTDKVMVALQSAGGTIMRSSFDETREEALQAALAGARTASRETGA